MEYWKLYFEEWERLTQILANELVEIFSMMRDILFEIFWLCGVQLICSSNAKPRLLTSITIVIGSEFVASFGIGGLTLGSWWNHNMNLFFSTFRDRCTVIKWLFSFSDIPSVFVSLLHTELLDKHRRFILQICSIYNNDIFKTSTGFFYIIHSYSKQQGNLK